MKRYRIGDMKKGWFIGQFEPTVLKTSDFEIAVKKYKAGESEKRHHHKIAKEITVVVSGQVEMCNQTFSSGDIIVLDPGESTSFKAITDVVNVVVKVPSATSDKFLDD